MKILTTEFSKLPAFEQADSTRYRFTNSNMANHKMFVFNRKQSNNNTNNNTTTVTSHGHESLPRSTVDINDIINLFVIKDLLTLNADEDNNQSLTNLFHSYSGIEEMIKAFLKENIG